MPLDADQKYRLREVITNLNRQGSDLSQLQGEFRSLENELTKPEKDLAKHIRELSKLQKELVSQVLELAKLQKELFG